VTIRLAKYKKSVLPVCDNPYHTYKRNVQKEEEIKVLRNCASKEHNNTLGGLWGLWHLYENKRHFSNCSGPVSCDLVVNWQILILLLLYIIWTSYKTSIVIKNLGGKVICF